MAEAKRKLPETEVVAPPQIDLTQLRARRTEMKQSASQGMERASQNAQVVATAAFELLKPVIPRNSEMKTLFG